MCELCPSTPQLASTRSVKPSSPGRPRWIMISFWRSSVIAARIRAASASSASSQLTRSQPPLAARAGPAQRIQDAVGVGHLVDGGGSLRAVAPPRARVLRVALELADLHAVAVHVGEQPARRLAVEARGGHQQVLALACARWPGPASRARPSRPSAPSAGTRPGGRGSAPGRTSRRGPASLPARRTPAPPSGVQVILVVAASRHGCHPPQASGTDWPACT